VNGGAQGAAAVRRGAAAKTTGGCRARRGREREVFGGGARRQAKPALARRALRAWEPGAHTPHTRPPPARRPSCRPPLGKPLPSTPIRQVVFLPPNDTACFDAYSVSARRVGGAPGADPPARAVDASLATVFTGLPEGAVYEFAVSATSAARGAGKPAAARAALPPAALDERPGPPERFRAVAAGDASMRLTWDAPAGNPRVDAYVINARETNATGWPLQGAAAEGAVPQRRAAAGDRSAVIDGLRPGSYYAFVIQAASSGRGDSGPAYAFRNTPARGARPPAAPRGFKVQPVGNGTVVLSWWVAVVVLPPPRPAGARPVARVLGGKQCCM
jgi:hypothetical protein